MEKIEEIQNKISKLSKEKSFLLTVKEKDNGKRYRLQQIEMELKKLEKDVKDLKGVI